MTTPAELSTTTALEVARWMTLSLNEAAGEPVAGFLNDKADDSRFVEQVTAPHVDFSAATPGDQDGAATAMLHLDTGEIFQVTIERVG